MAESLPPPYLLYENATYEYCFVLPPKVNSAGIWENATNPSKIFSYSLPFMEMQFVMVFLINHLVYTILRSIGITLFASQMFAGLIMVLMLKQEKLMGIFHNQKLGIQIMDTASLFGFTLFFFLTGVKMDIKSAFRPTKRSLGIGIVSLLSPILVGGALQVTFRQPNEPEKLQTERLIGTLIEGLTSFSVIACLLAELKILNTELGRLALSSSAVGDFSTLFLVRIITFSRHFASSPLLVLVQGVTTCCFIALLFFVFRPLMYWVIKRTPNGEPVAEVYITAIMMAAVGCAVLTHWTDRSPLIGAFLFGLAVPDGPPLGSALIDKFECFTNGLFLSVYVASSTMRVRLQKWWSDPTHVKFSAIFAISTFFAKLIPCCIGSFLNFMPFRDALAFGLIMSSKGIVQLSHICTFRDNKIISQTVFTAMLSCILVNATIVPPLVRFLYDSDSRKYASYEQRNLMHLKPNVELRVLACVHTPDNVPAMICLLDLTCSTKESPNAVYVIHLIELRGRNSPVFIAHHNQETSTVASSFFENIIPFYEYEGNNWDLVTVKAFTAITPPKLMHDDICTMALDKQTSFIILPFHRKWSIDGSLEEENNVVRNLNCKILDQAPCSVGILIDRGRIQKLLKQSSSSSFSIGMLFLGGKDDREALTLAKRMARDPRVKLTVIHLIACQDCRNVVYWDTVLDTEMLKDVKQNNGVLGNGCDIMYVEEVSNCGAQTIKLIRSIANDYDLIIVGRRYGVESILLAGLSEWSEFPDLGVIGDLFASTDLDSRVSVLVVQQQQCINVNIH
ncbi:cation/H(+) antiporter 4-like [Gossypium australe]|uniref:Cation/H(+) antiporter 4-like n=1 Tax=Gossypium australe TaxID=47621 RepID=A0A5B6VRD6_9ROSI|nr:cation/H(+) antiporter 4-like [Gossypium australe]